MTVKQLALQAIAESLSGLANELETLLAAAPAGTPPADNQPNGQALIEEGRSVAKTLLADGDTGGAENRAETLLRELEAAVEALKR